MPKKNRNYSVLFKKGQINALFQTQETDLHQLKTAQVEGLYHGPLAKNQATFDFEYVVRCLLVNEGKITAERDKASHFTYFFENAGVKYNLNEIIQNMNMEHLSFDEEDYNNYIAFLNDKSLEKPKREGGVTDADETYFRKRDKKGLYERLHFAEIAALNIYTQNTYRKINGVLRNQSDLSETSYANMLLHIGMMGSGLSKVQTTKEKLVFRYDHDLPQELIQQREASAESKGQGAFCTHESGFISTSSLAPHERFHGNNRTILFGVNQWDISALSSHPEREILLPPMQIKWTHVMPDPNNRQKKYFLGAPMRVVSGTLAQNNLGEAVPFSGEIISNNRMHVVNRTLMMAIEMLRIYEKHKVQQPRKTLVTHYRQAQANTAIKKLQDILNDTTLSPQAKLTALEGVIKHVEHNIQKEANMPFMSQKSELLGTLHDVKQMKKNFQKLFEEHKREEDAISIIEQQYQDIQRQGKSKPYFMETPEGQNAVNFVHQHFLLRPYNTQIKHLYGADWDLETEKGKIERPNHNLVHTMRVAFIVRAIATYLKAYSADFYLLSDAEINKAEFMMLFSVIGRESDIGFYDASNLHQSGKTKVHLYQTFKDNAKRGFKQYCQMYQPQIMTKSEINFWADALDTGKPGVKSPQGILMQIAHDLDLMRCYSQVEYGHKVKMLSKRLGGNVKAAEELLQYVYALNKATGDQCIGYGIKRNYDKNVFADCSLNPEICLEKLKSVPVPTVAMTHPAAHKKTGHKK